MNIYYTAKDIEEMAARGVQQVEIGPGVTLTDFARETANQMGITLVDSRRQAAPAPPPTSASSPTRASGKYNKPAGCMHAANSQPTAQTRAAAAAAQAAQGANSNTVNKLIDLMGKVINRGE